MNAGRPSSIASYAKQTSTRQDPRPINDRNYQMSCIRALNQYLESHRFTGTLLSQKGLPSGKDVKDIIRFLVHQLDPLWGELGKLEDEVPFIFRVYGYPFQINKSALYAVGRPLFFAVRQRRCALVESLGRNWNYLWKGTRAPDRHRERSS
jgi:kinetochore protein NDC80